MIVFITLLGYILSYIGKVYNLLSSNRVMSKEFRCVLCSKDIRNELFTFYSKGAVHFICFKDKASDKDDIRALLDMLEKELKLIVDYKSYIKVVKDDTIKKILLDNEKDVERHAALLTKFIAERKGL